MNTSNRVETRFFRLLAATIVVGAGLTAWELAATPKTPPKGAHEAVDHHRRTKAPSAGKLSRAWTWHRKALTFDDIYRRPAESKTRD